MGSKKYCLFFISVLLIFYLNHETTVNCLYRKHKDSKRAHLDQGGGGGVVHTQRPPPPPPPPTHWLRPYMITIINCYAPHSELTRKKTERTHKFYEELNDLIRKLRNKSSILIIGGDMNVSVGKKREKDCIGKYSKGERNENGDQLIELSELNNILLTNTCFFSQQTKPPNYMAENQNKQECGRGSTCEKITSN